MHSQNHDFLPDFASHRGCQDFEVINGVVRLGVVEILDVEKAELPGKCEHSRARENKSLQTLDRPESGKRSEILRSSFSIVEITSLLLSSGFCIAYNLSAIARKNNNQSPKHVPTERAVIISE